MEECRAWRSDRIRTHGAPEFLGKLLAIAGLIAAMQAADAQVKVWEGTLALPTYEEGMPNPNPPFDQYSASTNYPYALRDQMTDRRVEHEWRAVYLENEYLQCTILPDLGGHIYSCTDKMSKQSMFYANPSIKKAEIGYRGGWAAFGVEFNFPVSHNWVTVSPVDYSFEKHADGSASVFVGNIDRVYGMQWTVEAKLHPGSTVLELKVTLSNRSDTRHRFYWWSNAGIQVWDESRISYPMQFTASHGFTNIDTWPVGSTGTDLSLLKNQRFGPVSRFVYGSREPYMGIWHPETNTGIVHYAEYEELPGKKIWSWGSDADGYDWRKTLSDNNSAYMEVQGGLMRNQETYAFLEPRQSIHFTEYWMPARELGGIARANLDGVANLSRQGAGLHVAFNANHPIPAATMRIVKGSDVVFSEKVNVSPEKTWTHDVAEAAGTEIYTFEVVDASGAVLLRQTEGVYDWTPKSEVKVGPQQNYATPSAGDRTEDDWMQLGKDEELNGARLAAMADYKRALERFPTSLALKKAAGRLAADLLRYEEAVSYLEPVAARETWNAETNYYLGIAYEGLGRKREAMLALEAARTMPEFHAAASLRLGEMHAGQGRLEFARRELAEALKSAPDDLRSAEELVAVEQALGQGEAARTLASEWLARFPTSYFLREELGQPDLGHMGADVERVLNAAAQYMRLGMYEKAVVVLSRAYPAVAADEREPGEPAPQQHPMVAYYRGYCKQKMGRPAVEDFAAGAADSTQYVFPSGATSYRVLQAALEANAKDANAHYLLGTLEFSIGLTSKGMARWKEAAALKPKIPALDASIGRALLLVDGDTAGALTAFEKGAQSNDPSNLENYFGMDRAMSLLGRPAVERAAAIARYPDRENMPSALVYELALNLTEAGDYAKAEALFKDRFFQRAEGGTNVRQVWTEVRLQHALALVKSGSWAEALQMAAHLGDAVEGLEFTRDGMQAALKSARTEYLLGELYAACGKGEEARAQFASAATATPPGQMAWAAKAARKLGQFDQSKWKERIRPALDEEEREGTSLSTYAAAECRRELGESAAAEAEFRKVFLLPDSQLAYHLSRLALASGDR